MLRCRNGFSTGCINRRSSLRQLVASSTSGLYTLSVSKVGDMPILLAPLAEQTPIIAEVERRLSVIEELEANVIANLQRATRLRQSILHQAYATQ